jgi:pimeloyl-ACP methyl ester carboxylesterase
VSDVRVGPTRVRVEVVGSGPPLLMIMGIGGNIDMWAPLVGQLPGRTLVMFDFPGTGSSGMSFLPPTMGWNAVLVRRLIAKLGFSAVDVLGYSWGGLLAQHLAAQHRGAVRSVVLAATAVGVGGVPPPPQVFAAMLTPRRYYSAAYFRKVAPRIYGGRYRTDPDLVAEHAGSRLGRPPSPAGYVAQLAAVSGYSTLPLLPLIRARTLVLAGEDDPLAPARNARLLARGIRGAELEIIPGAGHLLLVDSPEIVGPRIDRFLSRPS